MKRLNSAVFILLATASCQSIAVDLDSDRYRNYKFTPEYGNESDKAEARAALENYFSDWVQVSSIKGATRWGERLVSAYRSRTNLEEYSKLNPEDQERIRRGESTDSGNPGSVITVFNAQLQHERDLEKNLDDLFTVAHYALDFYGCIEKEPLFTAPMIEGKGEQLFAITGFGMRDSSIKDRVTLSLYGENMTEIVREDIMLLNYHAFKLEESFDTRWPNDYIANETMPEGHILDIPDRRGRKKYAKMFVSDFNEDGLLDLLFWHRQYYSTLRSDKDRVGFIFEKQWFSHYVEKHGTDEFVQQDIDEENGMELLRMQGLRWPDGYPDNRICEEGASRPYSLMQHVLDDEIQ